MWFWCGFNQFAGHGKKDMLEPFKPEGVQNLKSEFVSQKSVPTWTGMDAWESAICVNKVELEKRKLPIPKLGKI